jgi:uncharacterized membrane protein
MTSRQADLICALLIASAFGLAGWLYGALPNAVPIHWNAAGHADGFMAKPWGAFVLPLTTLGTYLLLRVLPAVSPKGFRMDSFIGVYNVIVVAVVGFLLAITIASLLAASGVPLATRRLIPLGLGVLIVILGNYMGKLKKNFFVGIRTPWTLANDEVWARTHRFGGKLFVAAGIASMIGAATAAPVAVTAAAVVAAAVIAAAYSLVVYRRIEQ